MPAFRLQLPQTRNLSKSSLSELVLLFLSSLFTGRVRVSLFCSVFWFSIYRGKTRERVRRRAKLLSTPTEWGEGGMWTSPPDNKDALLFLIRLSKGVSQLLELVVSTIEQHFPCIHIPDNHVRKPHGVLAGPVPLEHRDPALTRRQGVDFLDPLF